jgi:hypothetical protein
MKSVNAVSVLALLGGVSALPSFGKDAIIATLESFLLEGRLLQQSSSMSGQCFTGSVLFSTGMADALLGSSSGTSTSTSSSDMLAQMEEALPCMMDGVCGALVPAMDFANCLGKDANGQAVFQADFMSGMKRLCNSCATNDGIENWLECALTDAFGSVEMCMDNPMATLFNEAWIVDGEPDISAIEEAYMDADSNLQVKPLCESGCYGNFYRAASFLLEWVNEEDSCLNTLEGFLSSSDYSSSFEDSSGGFRLLHETGLGATKLIGSAMRMFGAFTEKASVEASRELQFSSITGSMSSLSLDPEDAIENARSALRLVCAYEEDGNGDKIWCMDVFESIGETLGGDQEYATTADVVAAICPNGDGTDLLARSGCCARELQMAFPAIDDTEAALMADLWIEAQEQCGFTFQGVDDPDYAGMCATGYGAAKIVVAQFAINGADVCLSATGKASIITTVSTQLNLRQDQVSITKCETTSTRRRRLAASSNISVTISSVSGGSDPTFDAAVESISSSSLAQSVSADLTTAMGVAVTADPAQVIETAENEGLGDPGSAGSLRLGASICAVLAIVSVTLLA